MLQPGKPFLNLLQVRYNFRPALQVTLFIVVPRIAISLRLLSAALRGCKSYIDGTGPHTAAAAGHGQHPRPQPDNRNTGGAPVNTAINSSPMDQHHCSHACVFCVVKTRYSRSARQQPADIRHHRFHKSLHVTARRSAPITPVICKFRNCASYPVSFCCFKNSALNAV